MNKLRTYDSFILMENSTEGGMPNSVKQKIDAITEYTVIRPGTVKDTIKAAIDTAIEHSYYGVVVNPQLVDYAHYESQDDDITIISTLLFGETHPSAKEAQNEVMRIISDGAEEIDMLIDVDKFKKAYADTNDESKHSRYASIDSDIRTVADECHKNGVLLKVVIETGLLSLEELDDMCSIVINANADFVQTSSGAETVGAELSKVKELRRLLPDYIGIKAAGGIRTYADAEKFLPFIDRIGTSVVLK